MGAVQNEEMKSVKHVVLNETEIYSYRHTLRVLEYMAFNKHLLASEWQNAAGKVCGF